MQWAVLLLDTTLVWQSRWSRDLVSFGSARGRTAEVARLGGARAVESCEKMYKSKSRANFIVFFSPVSRDSGVWAEKVKSEVARLGGARAVRCFGRSTN